MPHSLGQHTELTIPSNISLRLESYAIPIEVIRLLAVISITKSLGVVSLKVRKIYQNVAGVVPMQGWLPDEAA